MKYSIFGESHGPAIGVVLEGLPSGLELDMAAIQKEMDRRKPGQSALSTARKEADVPKILSGVFEGRTTGTPLCAVIENTDQHSKDYSRTKDLARPGHADWPAHVRYEGCNDYRGGGHFSGRLTAPLVFAGAVAKQILAQKGIRIGAHISSIYGINDAVAEDMDSLLAVADNAVKFTPAVRRCSRPYWMRRTSRIVWGAALSAWCLVCLPEWAPLILV